MLACLFVFLVTAQPCQAVKAPPPPAPVVALAPTCIPRPGLRPGNRPAGC